MEEKLIESISGVRGVVGKTLTPDVVVRYAEAFARFSKRGTIVIGRDGRYHGASFYDILRGTLIASGCRVVDIGVCPTPTVELAVLHSRAAGGAIVTASHNPQEWNGLKFLNKAGIFLNAEENKRLLACAAGGPAYPGYRSVGSLDDGSFFVRDHIERVLAMKAIDVTSVRRRKLKVVVDAVNASGSLIVPELLHELGCKVVAMNCEPTGVFPRKPEPLPENITAVMKRVRKEKADLGVVVDPDADRLVLVTERGEPFNEEYTIAQAVDLVFKKIPKQKRIAVVNLSTTRAVDEIAKRRNGRVFRSAVGEINVVQKMKKVHATIGGEGSGGVILPEVHYGRDALVGIALALENLAEFGGTLSEYKKTLPSLEIVKKKIGIGKRKPDAVIEMLKDRFSKFKINTDDGLKVDAPDYWIHIRKSNTEPVMRIIAEARTKREAEIHIAEIEHIMEKQRGGLR